MSLETLQHTISVVLNYAAIGVGLFLFARWQWKRKNQKPTGTTVSEPVKKRIAPAISRTIVNLVIASIIVGIAFFIPERAGRNDSTSVCNAISVGSRFEFDTASLEKYRSDQKPQYGTLFAASYYPKVKDTLDGTGAVILVFLAGFPFSRAYCVVNLKEGTVESTRLMFNAEDYAYCDGEMRGLWECSDEKQK